MHLINDWRSNVYAEACARCAQTASRQVAIKFDRAYRRIFNSSLGFVMYCCIVSKYTSIENISQREPVACSIALTTIYLSDFLLCQLTKSTEYCTLLYTRISSYGIHERQRAICITYCNISTLRGGVQGCLGHHDLSAYNGLMLPRQVDLAGVTDVSCGEYFTLALNFQGEVYQMGSQGLQQHVRTPWEGADRPTRVGGDLLNARITHISCGRAHALALGYLIHLPPNMMPPVRAPCERTAVGMFASVVHSMHSMLCIRRVSLHGSCKDAPAHCFWLLRILDCTRIPYLIQTITLDGF